MAQMTLQQALDLANQHQRAGNMAEAENLYRQILALDPNSIDALHWLAVLVARSGRPEEGATLGRRALAIDPSNPDIWKDFGIILLMQEQFDAAIDAFRKVTLLRPQSARAFEGLGTVFQLARRYGDALQAYRTGLSMREADARHGPVTMTESELVAGHNLMTLQHHDPASTPQSIYEDHACWNHLYAAPLTAASLPHANDRKPNRRLRIGYISAYLTSAPVGRFMTGLFAHHDHQQFEIFCYSDVEAPDSSTEQLRRGCDVWRDTSNVADDQLAELIRQDQIDILIDLGMHAADNRMLVFARKPAPVQVTYLAYCSTTGLKAIDYRLSDSAFDPDDSQQQFYSEKTVRLRSYWCYPPPVEAAEVNALPATSHPSATVTFGCLNDFAKVSDLTFSMWGELLRSLPNSRLLLHAPNAVDQQQAMTALTTAGVAPGRIKLTGKVPMNDYFKLYHQVDIALDPTPWCGGTTTCDALWMGVPVVSVVGKTAISRGGLSILSQIGLPELVARDPKEYVSIATSLGRDLPRLAARRSTLRERMRSSPLMDAVEFSRDFESILRTIWSRWCAVESVH